MEKIAGAVPLAHVEEALTFAVASGWRPPSPEASDEERERETVPPPAATGIPERKDHHRALAARIASQCKPECLDPEDAVQAAHIGVLRAMQTYDPAKGTWPAYARWHALAEIQKAAGMNGGKHKRAKHRHAGMQSYDPHTDDFASAPAEEPEERLDAARDAARVRRVVAELRPLDQRRVRAILQKPVGNEPWRQALLDFLRARLEGMRRRSSHGGEAP